MQFGFVKSMALLVSCLFITSCDHRVVDELSLHPDPNLRVTVINKTGNALSLAEMPFSTDQLTLQPGISLVELRSNGEFRSSIRLLRDDNVQQSGFVFLSAGEVRVLVDSVSDDEFAITVEGSHYHDIYSRYQVLLHGLKSAAMEGYFASEDDTDNWNRFIETLMNSDSLAAQFTAEQILISSQEVPASSTLLDDLYVKFIPTTLPTSRREVIDKRRMGWIRRRPGQSIFAYAGKDPNKNSIRPFDSLDRELTLASFWASWCTPCREKHPDLKLLAESRSDQLAVVAISLDREKRDWIRAIEEDGIENFVNLSNLAGIQDEVALFYGISSLPQNILLDANGRIILNNATVSQIDAILKDRVLTQ